MKNAPRTTAMLFSAMLLLSSALSAPAWSQSQFDQQTGPALRDAYQSIKDKNYADAEQRLLALKEKLPDEPYVLLNLGVVYQMTGRKDEAIAMYERIVAADQDKQDKQDKQNTSGATTADEKASDRMIGRSPAEIAKRNLSLLRN